MPFTAFFDACVFYPAPLRDILLRLAATNLFRTRWSADVQAEWSRSLIANRPELAGKLDRTLALMDQAVPDAAVTGYHDLIPGLTLPDQNDRHVLAAAIIGRADVIVTLNLRDFPEERLQPFAIKAQHPDVFIRHVLDIDPPVALAAVKMHREVLKCPPLSSDDYLAMLARQGLVETVALLRRWNKLI